MSDKTKQGLMQHAGQPFSQGPIPSHPQFTPSEPIVSSSNSTTSSLRLWRKKDSAEKKNSIEVPTSTGGGETHVARVAPQTHYQSFTTSSDVCRYSNSFSKDCSPVYKQPTPPAPVKYSEIVEPLSLHKIDPTAQTVKDKDCIEMAGNPQLNMKQYSDHYGLKQLYSDGTLKQQYPDTINRSYVDHLKQSYVEHNPPLPHKFSYAENMKQTFHDPVNKLHPFPDQLKDSYHDPNIPPQYIQKESPSIHPAHKEPQLYSFLSKEAQLQCISKYNMPYSRSYSMEQNNYLAHLNKIHPRMAQSIISDPHLREAAQVPVYHNLDHSRSYAPVQRMYNHQTPPHMPPNHPYPTHHVNRNLPQHPYGYPPQSYNMNMKQNQDPYRIPSFQTAMPKYLPPTEQPLRNCSPRRSFNENLPIQMNYTSVPQKISPSIYPPCNQLEYSQHYQHRRDQLSDYYSHVGYKSSYLSQNPLTSELNPDAASTKSNTLKQFLESWVDEEMAGLPDVVVSSNMEQEKYTMKPPKRDDPNDAPLYILDTTEIPSENLPQYMHLQQFEKLPENIKGYYQINKEARGVERQLIHNGVAQEYSQRSAIEVVQNSQASDQRFIDDQQSKPIGSMVSSNSQKLVHPSQEFEEHLTDQNQYFKERINENGEKVIQLHIEDTHETQTIPPVNDFLTITESSKDKVVHIPIQMSKQPSPQENVVLIKHQASDSFSNKKSCSQIVLDNYSSNRTIHEVNNTSENLTNSACMFGNRSSNLHGIQRLRSSVNVLQHIVLPPSDSPLPQQEPDNIDHHCLPTITSEEADVSSVAPEILDFSVPLTHSEEPSPVETGQTAINLEKEKEPNQHKQTEKQDEIVDSSNVSVKEEQPENVKIKTEEKQNCEQAYQNEVIDCSKRSVAPREDVQINLSDKQSVIVSPHNDSLQKETSVSKESTVKEEPQSDLVQSEKTDLNPLVNIESEPTEEAPYVKVKGETEPESVQGNTCSKEISKTSEAKEEGDTVKLENTEDQNPPTLLSLELEPQTSQEIIPNETTYSENVNTIPKEEEEGRMASPQPVDPMPTNKEPAKKVESIEVINKPQNTTESELLSNPIKEENEISTPETTNIMEENIVQEPSAETNASETESSTLLKQLEEWIGNNTNSELQTNDFQNEETSSETLSKIENEIKEVEKNCEENSKEIESASAPEIQSFESSFEECEPAIANITEPNLESEFRKAYKIEEDNVLLQIGEDLLEINVTRKDGKKIITVRSLTDAIVKNEVNSDRSIEKEAENIANEEEETIRENHSQDLLQCSEEIVNCTEESFLNEINEENTSKSNEETAPIVQNKEKEEIFDETTIFLEPEKKSNTELEITVDANDDVNSEISLDSISEKTKLNNVAITSSECKPDDVNAVPEILTEEIAETSSLGNENHQSEDNQNSEENSNAEKSTGAKTLIKPKIKPVSKSLSKSKSSTDQKHDRNDSTFCITSKESSPKHESSNQQPATLKIILKKCKIGNKKTALTSPKTKGAKKSFEDSYEKVNRHYRKDGKEESKSTSTKKHHNRNHSKEKLEYKTVNDLAKDGKDIFQKSSSRQNESSLKNSENISKSPSKLKEKLLKSPSKSGHNKNNMDSPKPKKKDTDNKPKESHTKKEEKNVTNPDPKTHSLFVEPSPKERPSISLDSVKERKTDPPPSIQSPLESEKSPQEKFSFNLQAQNFPRRSPVIKPPRRSFNKLLPEDQTFRTSTKKEEVDMELIHNEIVIDNQFEFHGKPKSSFPAASPRDDSHKNVQEHRVTSSTSHDIEKHEDDDNNPNKRRLSLEEYNRRKRQKLETDPIKLDLSPKDVDSAETYTLTDNLLLNINCKKVNKEEGGILTISMPASSTGPEELNPSIGKEHPPSPPGIPFSCSPSKQPLLTRWSNQIQNKTFEPNNSEMVKEFEHLMHRFLKQEHLSVEELKKVKQIIRYKRWLQLKAKEGVVTNFCKPVFVVENSLDINANENCDYTKPKEDRKTKETFERSLPTNVPEKRHNRKRFRNLYSDEEESEFEDDAKKQNVVNSTDYSVHQRDSQRALKLVFKRSVSISNLQPVVWLERSDSLDQLAKNYS